MARLEDLIKDIADARLRNQIAAEVGKLKARKKFGLVFEQHLPEVVQLPGLSVRPGARVAKRGDKAGGFFVVIGLVREEGLDCSGAGRAGRDYTQGPLGGNQAVRRANEPRPPP